MKKQKLIIEYEYDFLLWGIVSAVREYKLAWCINDKCPLDLVREKDISYSSKSGKVKIINYKYETENSVIRLLKNRSSEEETLLFLVPELKHLDYFLIIDSEDDTLSTENLYHCLGRLSVIEYLLDIDINNLKSKENLIF